MSSTGETPTTSTPVAPASDAARDPATQNLFRMSRTAGVGLQDYAAVNALAVAGLLLGLLSFLAVVVPDSWAILVVPVAAIVVSITAFLQVRKSNGTQTGHLLAAAGLVLALAFAAVNVVGQVRTTAFEVAQKKELNVLAAKLLATTTTQGAQSTYELFDERFRESVPFETFQRQMDLRMRYSMDRKPVTEVTIGQLVVFESDDAGNHSANTLLRLSGDLKYPDGKPVYVEEGVIFSKRAGQPWRFQSITGWFGAIKPATPGAPGAAAQPAGAAR
jgi:hypothetical protein